MFKYDLYVSNRLERKLSTTRKEKIKKKYPNYTLIPYAYGLLLNGEDINVRITPEYFEIESNNIELIKEAALSLCSILEYSTNIDVIKYEYKETIQVVDTKSDEDINSAIPFLNRIVKLNLDVDYFPYNVNFFVLVNEAYYKVNVGICKNKLLVECSDLLSSINDINKAFSNIGSVKELIFEKIQKLMEGANDEAEK
jgi:hypothetical protein